MDHPGPVKFSRLDIPHPRRGGRAVDCTGLENRRPLTGFVSSNLTLSAKENNKLLDLAAPDSGSIFCLSRTSGRTGSYLKSKNPRARALTRTYEVSQQEYRVANVRQLRLTAIYAGGYAVAAYYLGASYGVVPLRAATTTSADRRPLDRCSDLWAIVA